MAKEIKIFQKPFSGKVLVIAPHPDDEVIGCGGSLIKHRKQNDEVFILYLTKGEKGDPQNKFKDMDYVSLRQKEAEGGLEILKIKQKKFLGFMDKEIKLSDRILFSILEVFKQKKPKIVYFPSRWEKLPDHKETAKIIKRVSKIVPKGTFFLEYQVHSFHKPNLAIDISDVYRDKIEALFCHKSQFVYFNYKRLIENFNRYWTSFYKLPFKHIETFYFWQN
jgi:LmbE family N-acetylglucosaminyl deacetylase